MSSASMVHDARQGSLWNNMAPFVWLISHDWKYCWLICCERKIIFVRWKSTDYKTSEQGKIYRESPTGRLMSRYLLCVYENEGCIYVLDQSGRQEVNPAATDILRMFICASLCVHGMWVAHLFCRIWCSKRMTREMQIYNSIVTYIGSMSSCAYHLYIQPCVWFTRWVLYLLV